MYTGLLFTTEFPYPAPSNPAPMLSIPHPQPKSAMVLPVMSLKLMSIVCNMQAATQKFITNKLDQETVQSSWLVIG